MDRVYLDRNHLPAAWEAAVARDGQNGLNGHTPDPSRGGDFAENRAQAGGSHGVAGAGRLGEEDGEAEAEHGRHGVAAAAPLSYDLVYLCPPLEFVGQRHYLQAVLAFWLPHVRAGGVLAGSGYYTVLAPGAEVSARVTEGREEGVGDGCEGWGGLRGRPAGSEAARYRAERLC
jgi:hypothetical protein